MVICMAKIFYLVMLGFNFIFCAKSVSETVSMYVHYFWVVERFHVFFCALRTFFSSLARSK